MRTETSLGADAARECDAEETIAKLTAERDCLRERLERAWQLGDKHAMDMLQECAENRHLRDELAGCRRDAARFRWIIENGECKPPLYDGCKDGRIWLDALTGIRVERCVDGWPSDQIDAAIATEQETVGPFSTVDALVDSLNADSRAASAPIDEAQAGCK